MTTCRPSGIQPVLELRDLHAWRDDRCLFSGLSLTLQAGDVLQVAGANGVGKTTLLHGVAGLSERHYGHIHWAGELVNESRDAYLRDLLFIGHLPGVKGALTVAENLQTLAHARGIDLTESALTHALTQVRLSGYEDCPVAQLSAGQKRRVALARLFTEPVRLWILDEPFTAIDQLGVVALEDWIADHARAGGIVLLTTHHVLNLSCPLRQCVLTPPEEHGC